MSILGISIVLSILGLPSTPGLTVREAINYSSAYSSWSYCIWPCCYFYSFEVPQSWAETVVLYKELRDNPSPKEIKNVFMKWEISDDYWQVASTERSKVLPENTGGGVSSNRGPSHTQLSFSFTLNILQKLVKEWSTKDTFTKNVYSSRKVYGFGLTLLLQCKS